MDTFVEHVAEIVKRVSVLGLHFVMEHTRPGFPIRGI